MLTASLLSCSSGEDRLQKLVDKVYSTMTVEEKAAQLYGIYPSEVLVDGKVYYSNSKS